MTLSGILRLFYIEMETLIDKKLPRGLWLIERDKLYAKYDRQIRLLL